MLQIEEWFRRPQRKNEEETKDETAFQGAPDDALLKPAAQEHVSDAGAVANDTLEGTEKDDLLLQQIDEFREKAMQLQKLMQSRELQARQLQDTVKQEMQGTDEHCGEADKLVDQVTQRIDEMSLGVRIEMNGLSDAVSKEVGGLTQNLTHELNQSTEKTRLAVEAAAQNMIDQNVRSMKGIKEQLDQMSHLEQFGDLSSEMNSQMSTLKTDIVDRIHAEDVKCYRNIQASLDEQSNQLTKADESTREFIREQMGVIQEQLGEQEKLLKLLVLLAGINVVGGLILLIFLLLK